MDGKEEGGRLGELIQRVDLLSERKREGGERKQREGG